MYTILLVTHTLIVLFLIGIILVQRSSEDGLGGLSGGGGNVLSGRAAGNVLTRITAILATLFICTSLALAMMSGQQHQTSILDAPALEDKPAAVTGAPATSAPAPQPETPSVPKPE